MDWLILGLKLSCIVLVVVFGFAYAAVRMLGREMNGENDL